MAFFKSSNVYILAAPSFATRLRDDSYTSETHNPVGRVECTAYLTRYYIQINFIAFQAYDNNTITNLTSTPVIRTNFSKIEPC